MKETKGINKYTEKLLFASKKIRKEPFHNGDYLFDIELSNLRYFDRTFKFTGRPIKYVKPRTINLENGKIYHYVKGDMDIVYEKLSDKVVNPSIKRELLSVKRYGKCHEMSLSLLNSLEGSSILTGYIAVEDEDILHSVVEYESDGKTKIVDYTKNIIMDKEDYIGLMNFRNIQRITREQFLKDEIILMKMFGSLNIRTYLCFRDEIMNEIKKKNKKVLKIK